MRSGRVEYTDRAYRQDAGQAMRGDVVRALIELITNSDDAYGDEPGEIIVRLDPPDDDGRVRLSVADQARGLTAEEMVRFFGTLGGRDSGFAEGRVVRGNLGRGAKDTSFFGRTEFEAVRDGAYSRFVLSRDGEWTLELEDVPATDELLGRVRLGPGQNGLVATLVINREHRVPGFDALAERLGRVAQLRDITSRRELVLEGPTRRGVYDIRPVVYEAPASEEILNTTLHLDDYPDAEVHLLVEAMDNRQEGSVSEESHHGLLVCSGSTIYQNTLFGLGGRLHAGWLRGRIHCDHIDQLVREYDERDASGVGHDASNPVRLIDRDRDGLVAEHPFTSALTQAVTLAVGPLIDRLEQERGVQRREGDELRRSLEQAAHALADLVTEDLDELDEPEAGTDERSRGNAPVRVIPPEVRIQTGGDQTLTVVVWDEIATRIDSVAATSDTPDVVEIVDIQAGFVSHPRLEGVSVSRVRIKALRAGDAHISVQAGTEWGKAHVVVTDEPPRQPEPPEGLQFQHARCSVTAGRRRTIAIWSDIELAAERHGEDVRVVVKTDEPGITLHADHVPLRLDEKLGWYVGRVPIEGRHVGTSTKLIATFGGQQAECTVRVVDPSDPTALGIDIQVVDEHSLSARAVVEDGPDGLLIRVLGRHPGVVKLLGRYVDGSGFERENEPEARAVLAEIIAGELAEWLLVREAERYPERFRDAASALAQRRSRLRKYLPRCQGLLLA